MKKLMFRQIIDAFLFGSACTMMTLAMILWAGGAVYAVEEDWPREIIVPEGEIVIYQPQLETFKGDKLTARAAVSVTRKGETEPVFGAVWFDARVQTDRDTRIVTPLEVKVSDARFPNAPPEKVDKLKALLEKEIPKWELQISLDRLLTMLELVEKEKIASEDLNTNPPKIIFVTHPAALVTLDGDPELRKVENSKLMRVVNTPTFMVLDPSTKTYYLKGSNEWFATSDIMGQWKEAASPPASVTELADREAEQDPQDTAPTEPKPDRMPQIIVATGPTELIVSDGEPNYTPIGDTNLLYMSNTDSDVFMEIGSQKYYVVLSGRWFNSASLNGPWSHVPPDKLPADFAKISPGSEKGNILASVAGTEEAREAELDTHIPQTTAIKRDGTINVTYDGKPKFKQIKGTAMDYAVNTGYSVIRFGGLYYCCHEAVWYVSDDPSGPWAVCVSVPQEIYTIPPEYPVYNVKYVHVYDYTPTVVYVGYTPGYAGTYVYGGTVVYGTGYVYRGWYGPVYYYPRPVTYGYPVAYRPYYGWGVAAGFAAGVWASNRYGGWYGGYRRHGDVDININRSTNINRNNVYNRQGNTSRNVGGRDRPGAGAGRDRPGTGAGKDRPGLGKDRPGVGKDRPGTGAGRDRPGTGVGKDRLGAGAGRDKVGSGTRPKRENNVFADRDGNIHRKTDQGWQQRDRSGWSDTSRSKPDPSSSASRDRSSSNRSASRPDRSSSVSRDRSSSSRNRSDLNRHSQARQRGTQRTNNYRRSRSSGGSRGMSRPSRGGGGRRGGGRR
jgi:hypothetical protein